MVRGLAIDAESGFEGQILPLTSASIRRGILWNAAGQVAARVLSLLFLPVLARLIAPRGFGLFAIGSAVLLLASVLADIGVASALIQRQQDTRANASAAFYMNALAVVLFGVGILVLSVPIARFYEQPAVRPFLSGMTAAFVVRGLVVVHEAYLRKRMLFRRLQLIGIASVLASGTVSVFLAWFGLGGWSLVWGLLAGNCVYAGLVLAGSGMPLSMSPYIRRWRDLFAFGRWVLLARITTWVLQTADNLAVGKFLGPTDLGAYALAWNYGLIPFGLIGDSIGQAMFPAYSRLQIDRERLEALLMTTVRITAVMSLPMAGILLFSGGDVLVALLGPRWIQAGPPFHVFAVVYTSAVFVVSFPRVYEALNRPIINLYIALGGLPVLVGGTAIGLRFGIFGVAVGISVMMVELTCLQVFAMSKVTSLSVGTILGGLWPPALCVGLGIAAGSLPFMLLRSLLPSLAVDAAASLVMLAFYLLTLRHLFPSLWSEGLSQARAVLDASRVRR